ncbi:competence type IV pilus assembly protein ComGB [Dellaglioa carnosa]|uniref:competence type IV pilus assembly protein ComGB n=1 Tax=Dellaglioa carnosa TaxID=2995136 RepID=UPI0022A834D0|nr:competence type IV pilus assembly protein ComGB [Dellaglioa carnosa]MCZ2492918.1 competence type IV pilus assembly protein ComGB [Dellaglioa carnosa]
MLNALKTTLLHWKQQVGINRKRWTIKKQSEFFEVLADLLDAGFSLKQALTTTTRLFSTGKLDIQKIEAELSHGEAFSTGIKPYISKSSYYQIMISEKYGGLNKSINQLGKLMAVRVKQKKQLKQLLQYPIILMGLLIALYIGIQQFILPEINNSQLGTTSNTGIKAIIVKSIISLFVSILIGYGIKISIRVSKQTTMNRHVWYCQIPVVGKIYKDYCHYYLTFNLGLLLSSGLNLNKICDYLNQFDQESLLYQLGRQLTQHFEKGGNTKQMIDKNPLFPKELTVFLEKGNTLEVMSQELLIFSELTYRKFKSSVEKMMVYVQPIAFIIVAACIVGLYLAILLPMYQTMEEIK